MNKLIIIIFVSFIVFISKDVIIEILLVSPYMDDSLIIAKNFKYLQDYPKTLKYYKKGLNNSTNEDIVSHILELDYNESIIYFKYYSPDRNFNFNKDSVKYGIVFLDYDLDSVLLNLDSVKYFDLIQNFKKTK